MTDDPVLSAVVSSALSARGQYFSVFEAPRMQRPDADREIITLLNNMRRVQARYVLYGKDVDKTVPEQMKQLLKAHHRQIASLDEISSHFLESGVTRLLPTDGVTNTNAAQKLFDFSAGNKSTNRLAVVVQNTNEVDSVIAANYAIARNANFFMIDISPDYLAQVNSKLNKMADAKDRDVRKIDLNTLTDEFKALLPNEDFSKYNKVLFITEGFPLGIAIPDVPSAHLPKLRVGLTIAANLGEYTIALNRKHAFNGVFLRLPDKGITTKTEEDAMSDALLRTSGLVKHENMRDAKLGELTVEVFPYDILYIATHGGQIEANLNSYEYTMPDGTKHEVKMAVGIGPTATLHKIESVDGVQKDTNEWKKEQIDVWADYAEKVIRGGEKLNAFKTERVSLEMRTLQFEPASGDMGSGGTFNVLAGGYLPLVIVNACGSWNDLSGNFVFAGCSSYIGTILPVTNATAASYAVSFFDNLFCEELINAAHKAKHSLKDDYEKSLYVFTGTFESKFDFASGSDDPNGIEVLQRRIPQEIKKIEDRLKELESKESKKMLEAYKVQAMYLEHELSDFIDVVNSV